MTLAKDDTLLKIGKVIALLLQGFCVLGGGVFLLVIVFVALVSAGMLGNKESLPDIAQYPLLVTGIGITVIANFAAMFVFFGKMRTLIESARMGDPFIPENAQRLNMMAWLLLGSQVLTVIVGEIRVYAAGLLNPQAKTGFDIDPNDFTGFLIVLVLFILARVFKHGAAMREDLEGTV